MNEEQLLHYLREHQLYPDDVVMSEDMNNIRIDILWGDWKHEHGYTDYLMGQIGYRKATEQIIEEDGSDCYSSTHEYIKV